MQIIVEVEVEAGTYASEQYQSRISAPSVCPNCGIAQSLEAHGYYQVLLCARSLFPETGDTIITEEVRKFPSGK